MGVRGPPLHRSRAWVSCFHPWLQLSASLVCARGTYFTSAHPQLNLTKLLTANCWGTWGSDLGDPDWSNESSLSRGNAQVWIPVPSNFLPCVFCRRYYSPDHPCSTSIDFCSSWAIFRIKPAHSFWEETGCGYIDYCPGSCNAVFTLLQALWTEKQVGAKWQKEAVWVKWCAGDSASPVSVGTAMDRASADLPLSGDQRSLLKGTSFSSR